MFDLGPIEQNIAKQALMANAPLPDRIANAPELLEGLSLYLQAFFDLDSDRTHGMGLMKIPWSSIKSYSEFYKFDEEQTEDLFFFIREMDSEHLKRLDKKGS